MEDNQPQLHQQALVHSPDEIMSMQLNSETTVQQAPLSAPPSLLPMMPPGPMYPYPAAYPPAQPFPLLYPTDPSAVYPGSLIPEHQYAYCYYPTAAYHPMQAVQLQSQQQTGGSAKTTTANSVAQQGVYPGVMPPGTSAAQGILPPSPVSGNSGYPGFQPYGPMPLVPQHHLMPCYCCSQAPLQHQYQQQLLLHSQQMPLQDLRLQQMPTRDASYTEDYHDQMSPQQQQSHTELYHQQQLLNDTARLEANFEVDNRQPMQSKRYLHIQSQQHNLMPVNRRRNGYMHNILYKTELCRDVQEKGVCPRGKTCQFAHTQAELHDPRKHPLYKTAFCFDYKNRGYCPRGPHCFHVHDISELKTPPPFFSQQQPQQTQQQLMPSSASRGNSQAMPTPRLPRSNRMRRRQPPMHQQLVDEAPGPSHDRRASIANQEHQQSSEHQSAATVAAASADTPFNFLMKKLQQQHQEKSVEPAAAGVGLRAIEDKAKSLGLTDAWNLEPVRAAQ